MSERNNGRLTARGSQSPVCFEDERSVAAVRFPLPGATGEQPRDAAIREAAVEVEGEEQCQRERHVVGVRERE